MKLIILLGILLTLTPSSALSWPDKKLRCPDIRSVNFLRPDEALSEIPKALDYISASAIMDFFDDRGDGCSGAFVSDEGHILTASHCLETCRKDAGTMQPPYDCKMKINGRTITVEVLVAATCSPDKVRSAQFYLTIAGEKRAKEEFGKCVGQSDLAILKTKDPIPFKCLPIGLSSSNLGDRVATLGRPAATERAKRVPNAKDADGKSRYYSTGEIIKSATCTRIINGISTQRIVPEALEGFSHYLQTTVDMNHKSSGGPLLNQQGQVIGVASFMLQDGKEECRGSTFFERLDGLNHLAEISESHLRTKDLKCSRRSVGLDL